MMKWDDATRVATLEAETVQPLLEAAFASSVTQTDDAERYGANWQDYAPLCCARSYLPEALGGPYTAAAQVDRMRAEFRVTRQQITFRAFLMGGGV
jgi:hypothetical protein